MISPIADLVFISTGSFVIWATKGFKGTFDKEMVPIDQRNSSKGLTRFLLGLGIWLIIIINVSVVLTRLTRTETKAYEGRLNEKGELVVEEIK
jgi:hypothetical protein